MSISSSSLCSSPPFPRPAPTTDAGTMRWWGEEFINHTADGVWQADQDGRILFANRWVAEMLGFLPEELVGTIGFDLVHPEDIARIRQLWARRLAGHADHFEWRLRRKDGRYVWCKASSVPLRDALGVVVGSIVLFSDLTRQKQLEEELQRREARQRVALLVSRAGTYSWNLRTGETTWDDSLRYVFGLRDGESVDSYEQYLQRVHPEDRAHVVSTCATVMARRSDLSLDYRILTPTGIRWIHARGKAPDPDSDIMVGACIDVTDQSLAQAQLRESKERLVAALAASHTGTFRWNIRTDRLEWDLELNRLFGLQGVETAGALPDFFALVHADDRPRVMAACERCRCEGADFHEEFRIPLADGSIRWLEDKGRTFFDRDGQPAYMTGACVDITARKDAEIAVQLNRERFELVREASGVGFWFCDVPNMRLEWDVRVRAHFGLQPDAPVTMDLFYELLHPDDRERTRRAVERSIATNGSYDVEYRALGRDGVTRWIRAIGTTRSTADGRPYRFDGITIDISENVRARELLQTRGEELELIVAERTSSLRDTVAELEKFSYSISHDLRAPLRAMQSFALILREECEACLPEEGRDYLRRIVLAADRMDQLIQDVLSYSKLARGDIALQPVDFRRLVTGIIETYPQFHDPAATISVLGSFPPVRGNEAALTQCISNLLGNAIKFRRPDVHPEIKVWCEELPEGPRLCVRDNGIGIRPENLERIFSLFEQVNPDAGGTGIGLAIVRKAAEKMGARVGVASEYGVGTTFWVEFPHQTFRS